MNNKVSDLYYSTSPIGKRFHLMMYVLLIPGRALSGLYFYIRDRKENISM